VPLVLEKTLDRSRQDIIRLDQRMA
jgi:hypothetical protein